MTQLRDVVTVNADLPDKAGTGYASPDRLFVSVFFFSDKISAKQFQLILQRDLPKDQVIATLRGFADQLEADKDE